VIATKSPSCAIRSIDNKITTESKIRVPWVPERPTASLGGERADLFGGGQPWIGEGTCLGGRQGRLFRRNGCLEFGAAVCPGLPDLINRDRPGGQET
jgi:hypothetical protein